MRRTGLDANTPLDALIIGTGFAGIGMAITLKKAGFGQFLILEKQQEVGGVWRDNSYPGAACDVPSHLYSFSFELNPNWSRVFAPQAEIHRYLTHCADKYGLRPFIQFGSEVAQASYDEQLALWVVRTTADEVFYTRVLITATGQLSRPVYPKLSGIETFKGQAFHSAHWDHTQALDGKRVAVVGTGASAIQFVPAIAGQVKAMTVFQRSAPYILPRPDGPYAGWRKALFAALPWTMKLHRARIYAQYEGRAIGFTRIRSLMDLLVGLPFKALLRRQVADPQLRARLTPDYPIGCKRILLSNDYLSTLAKPHVKVVSEGIRRITPEGIETNDGQRHEVDAIIYGTGFAATEFLAPMTITGRGGRDLNDAWRQGAQAYLGITVPAFPNFFMLYGPNTNLGHSSIIYMLESQIAHVVRCLEAARQRQASAIEVDPSRYTHFNRMVQERLAATVWQGCKSWYVDANGHNSTNWPGFTFGYRWLTRHASLNAYLFSSPDQTAGRALHVAEPIGLSEAIRAAVLRTLLQSTFKQLIRPPFGVAVQRLVVEAMSRLMPGDGDARVRVEDMGGVRSEKVFPARHALSGKAMLYLHGGAFCVGSPRTHRTISTRLATATGMTIYVPDYRLAPEHPHPAALDDALACYRAMLQQGMSARDIVICGDSAGGALALLLALRLRDQGETMPAGLMLMSPFLDGTLSGFTVTTALRDEPMLNISWLKQALRWNAAEGASADVNLLDFDLSGLPPMLIQVGDQEVLGADSARLHERAGRSGVASQLEVYSGRWHVFQLQSAFLVSARNAINQLAAFALTRVSAPVKQPAQDN